MLRLITFAFVMVAAVSSSARAQGAFRAADVAQLEATADAIAQRAVVVRRSDAVLATSIEHTLADLRDDIAFLRVKIRRNTPITPAEFGDVRDRLEALRVRAQAPPGRPGSPAGPPPAPAQGARPPVIPPMLGEPLTWTDKVFVNFGAGKQLNSQTVSTDFTFPLYEEIASVTVTHKIKSGTIFDVTGGVRLGEHIGAAVNIFARSGSSAGAVTGSIPDPILFDSPRTVTATIPKMVHHELWIAPLLVYAMPVNEKTDLMVMVGPALAKIKHDLVTSATVTEASGGPTVAVGLTQLSHSYITFEVGADVRYMLTANAGIGAFVRYGGTNANVSSSLKVKVGGLQVGGGLRVRF